MCVCFFSSKFSIYIFLGKVNTNMGLSNRIIRHPFRYLFLVRFRSNPTDLMITTDMSQSFGKVLNLRSFTSKICNWCFVLKSDDHVERQDDYAFRGFFFLRCGGRSVEGENNLLLCWLKVSKVWF